MEISLEWPSPHQSVIIIQVNIIITAQPWYIFFNFLKLTRKSSHYAKGYTHIST